MLAPVSFQPTAKEERIRWVIALTGLLILFLLAFVHSRNPYSVHRYRRIRDGYYLVQFDSPEGEVFITDSDPMRSPEGLLFLVPPNISCFGFDDRFFLAHVSRSPATSAEPQLTWSLLDTLKHGGHSRLSDARLQQLRQELKVPPDLACSLVPSKFLAEGAP